MVHFAALYKQLIELLMVVAIKKLQKKDNSWEGCLELREIKVFLKVIHDNIIKLKEASELMMSCILYMNFVIKSFYVIKESHELEEVKI